MEERTDKSFTTSAESSASPSLSQRASNIEKEATKKAGNRKALVIGVIMVIVVLILFIGAIVFLTADHARTANIRDIVIILYAFGSLLMSLAIGILLVLLVYRLQELIGFLRGELVPALHSVQKTMNTVRGTTTFVSDNVAKPTIRVASFMAGVQQMARSANAKVRNRNGHGHGTSDIDGSDGK